VSALEIEISHRTGRRVASPGPLSHRHFEAAEMDRGFGRSDKALQDLSTAGLQI